MARISSTPITPWREHGRRIRSCRPGGLAAAAVDEWPRREARQAQGGTARCCGRREARPHDAGAGGGNEEIESERPAGLSRGVAAPLLHRASRPLGPRRRRARCYRSPTHPRVRCVPFAQVAAGPRRRGINYRRLSVPSLQKIVRCAPQPPHAPCARRLPQARLSNAPLCRFYNPNSDYDTAEKEELAEECKNSGDDEVSRALSPCGAHQPSPSKA